MVALFMDGKTFPPDEMIIALGVTLTGEKVILGLLQTATENEKVTKEFLDQLLDRGLKIEEGCWSSLMVLKDCGPRYARCFATRRSFKGANGTSGKM